jgi:hypothetical protein
MRLFDCSLAAYYAELGQRAAQAVRQLDRRAFGDPGLAKCLDDIANSLSLDVAVLRKGEVSAERFEEERMFRDAFGDPFKKTMCGLNVSIPFTGDGDSFRLSPSRATQPGREAELTGNCLAITVPLTDGSQVEVDRFIQIVSENLDGLRRESDLAKVQLRKNLDAVADQRKKEIETQQALESKLSFPIRG